MGSKRQRSGDDSWELRVDLPRGPDARRRQMYCTFHGTEQEADLELARLEAQVRSGGLIVTPDMTLKDYLPAWLDGASISLTDKTRERYAEIIEKNIIPVLGNIKLRSLNTIHITAFLSEMLDNGRRDGKGGLSRQTVSHLRALLHKALQDAVNARLLPYNPVDSVPRPKPDQREKRIPTEEELLLIIEDVKGSRLYVPTLLAYATGMRRGEIFALRWKNIDLDCGILHVVESLGQTDAGLKFKPPKSRAGRRQIALSPMTVQMLRKHKAAQAKQRLRLGSDYQDHDLVFPLEDGRPWPPDSVTTLFGSVIKRLGLSGISFHSLRHMHATLLLSKYKVHPKVVTERLGHSDVSITLRLYSHVSMSMQEEAAAKIDESIRIMRWED